MTHHVILGAGPAGVIAAETLRKHAPQDSITLVGDEPDAPYSRMAIPYLLIGNIDENGTYLRKSASHFEDLRITQVKARVTRVDAAGKTVQLNNGQSLGFDNLLIATGSHPVRPPIAGMDLPGVHPCWTLADARAIQSKATRGKRVLQMGAGFIGCIIMEALQQRGVGADQMHRHPATQASFSRGTARHPFGERTFFTGRFRQFIELQQRMGQMLTDQHQCLVHVFAAEQRQQGQAIGQWITQVMQNAKRHASEAFAAGHQWQAQMQMFCVPAEQNVQALILAQGLLCRAQPAKVVERRVVGHLQAQCLVGRRREVGSAQGRAPFESHHHRFRPPLR